MPYPVNHVGLSVPDAEAAAEWYTSTLGFSVIRPLRTIDRATDPENGFFRIFPASLQRCKLVGLGAINGVGIELMEFGYDAATQEKYGGTSGQRPNLLEDTMRGGYFHVAFTVQDPEELCKRACEKGARKIGETVNVHSFQALYVEDPWGNILELLNAAFEDIAERSRGGHGQA